MSIGNKYIHITSFQMIILGFLAIIIGGSLLLMLPIATVGKESANFLDALFTAVSAVCVTGLVVHDTATYWSLFGQAVILLLIQVGGLGVITVAIAVILASGKKIGLMQRSTMQEAIAAPQLGGIVKLTQFILRMGFTVELIGAMILASVFCRKLGIVKGIWYGVFHAVSAFCNAGFDLNGYWRPYASLTAYSSQPVVNLTIMLLIITGGLGFLTWADIGKNRWEIKRYRMQSKVIFCMTAILIAVPALYFFLAEFTHLPIKERIWVSLFQAVTPRTAGFNTTDLTKISEPGQMLMILLMLIGGAPGSTAGGMKITTVAVLTASAVAVFRRKDAPNLFGRRIAQEAVLTAGALMFAYIVLTMTVSMLICRIDRVSFTAALFEASSAIGTVGLSLGITEGLSDISHILLMLLMFFGRVGCLTLVYAACSEKRVSNARLPQEKITVG